MGLTCRFAIGSSVISGSKRFRQLADRVKGQTCQVQFSLIKMQTQLMDLTGQPHQLLFR